MRKHLGVALAALVLASCGQPYATIKAPVAPSYGPRTFSRQATTPQAIVARANETFAAMPDFLAEVTTWAVEEPGDRSTEVYGEATMHFKKARKERLEITKADDDPKKVGTIVVYTGGDKAQVLLPKAIPVLGKLFTLKLTDKKLTTSRGVRLDQMDVQAMLGRLSGNRAVLSPDVKEATVDGRKALVVTATGTFKGIDDEVTSEETAFDIESGMPVLDTAFIGKQPVLRLGLRNLKPNVGVTDDKFVLKSLAPSYAFR